MPHVADSFLDGVPVTDTTSKANFGFVAKHKQGASTPTPTGDFHRDDGPGEVAPDV